MNDKLKTSSVDLFAKALLSLNDKKECLEFLEDICTINEILSFSQRFEVAKMLKKKNLYRNSKSDWCFHSYNKPCKPFSYLWQWQL